MTRFIAILLVCWLASTAVAVRGATPAVRMTLVDSDRTVAGGRAVQVVLPQTQIETTIEVGRVANDVNGGGLVGAIIIPQLDDKREMLSQSARRKAEAAVAPLRRALQGFDVKALAMAAAKALNWPQSALIAYRYETSPDFTQVRVIAEIELNHRPATTRKGSSLIPLDRQRIVSIMQLRESSFEPSENVRRWSANDGKLAKAALTNAFARQEQLIPLALALSDADVKTITAKGRDKTFAAGFYGPRVEAIPTNPGETLIWKDGLVSIRLSED